MKEIIIDAGNSVLGRVASYAAKQSLLGNKVIILNCSNIILSGKRSNIIKEYRSIREKGGSSMKGPYFPKQPDRIMRRTIRGMLSSHQTRGRDAFKRILCFNNIPKEYEASNKISTGMKEMARSVSLLDLSREI